MGMMYAFQRQQIYLSSVTGILSAVALAVAVLSVVSYGANLATAFLIFNYTSSIAGQLFTFSNNSLRNFNRSFGDASDMVDILALEPEILDPEEPEKLRIKGGSITFKDVTFTHAGADESIFTNFNLTIKNGEKIGLVGHSGSGKTTFTRLLLRFSDIDGGSILIDDQNIARITQTDLHEQIAYVPQEPLLFHRSIYENIAYGLAKPSMEDVRWAAKQAHAAEFIDRMPDGYDTLVGERGVKLSGGQRQRIVIARAMLKNAPILLLDEATSALDSESEVLIQDALWKLMEGRTAIVIAHRLSTIQKMDRIIVLGNGDIIESGTHKELLHVKGTYASLWAHQSGGFLED
jgi:ATP-binding cassette subfamily B protein